MENIITGVQIALTIFAAAAGFLRFLTPYAKFVKIPFQEWGVEFKPWQIKLIGLLEIAAAVGLVLSLFMPSMTMLTGLAAVGVALVMAGAMAIHFRRLEYLNMGGNFVWLGLALFLAYSKLLVVTAV
jgi:hypothetical protein